VGCSPAAWTKTEWGHRELTARNDMLVSAVAALRSFVFPVGSPGKAAERIMISQPLRILDHGEC
jgi:hypothetical protein